MLAHRASYHRVLGELSARSLALALVVAGIAIFSTSTRSAAFAASAGALVLLLGVDIRNPLSLRNFFLVYTVVLFSVGVPLFGLEPDLYGDMVVYCGVFLLAYMLVSFRLGVSGSPQAPAATEVTAAPARSVLSLRGTEELLLVLISCKLLLLGVNLLRYGIGAFYAGQLLVDQLNAYGKASLGGGIFQVATFFLKYTSLAVAIIYVEMCFRAGAKIRYRYLVLLFVVLPIVSLERSDAVHGVGMLLIISALDRRVRAQGRKSGSWQESTRRGRPRRAFALLTAAVVTLFAAVLIGGIRQGRITQSQASTPPIVQTQLLQSELTPINAYGDIKQNQARVGRTHGSTVIWPLLLKVVPRGFFPGKPLNSGAYFMTVVHPAEFAAGYALPPTLFGDAYINFGFAGAILACVVVGLLAAHLDVAYKEARLPRMGAFLIVYASFYAVLRSPLAESLAGILLTLLVWRVLRGPLRASARQRGMRLSRVGAERSAPVPSFRGLRA